LDEFAWKYIFLQLPSNGKRYAVSVLLNTTSEVDVACMRLCLLQALFLASGVQSLFDLKGFLEFPAGLLFFGG